MLPLLRIGLASYEADFITGFNSQSNLLKKLDFIERLAVIRIIRANKKSSLLREGIDGLSTERITFNNINDIINGVMNVEIPLNVLNVWVTIYILIHIFEK